MSQKFHLNTCIFRIHRFDIKFLGTNNLNLFVIHEFFLDIVTLKEIGIVFLVYNLISFVIKFTCYSFFTSVALNE